MGDLISRQAAIDDLHGKDPSQLWDTADIEVWVNALPSAQPEPCEDAVSRADVLECFADLYDTLEDCSKGIINELHRKFEDLRTLPSVTPKAELCEDAVNRKDAIIQLSHNKNGDPDCDVIIQHDIETLKRLPSVTPKRKTGKWIDQKGGGCCCSECGRYALDEVDGNFIHVVAKSNFCPNCGAEMEVKSHDSREDRL